MNKLKLPTNFQVYKNRIISRFTIYSPIEHTYSKQISIFFYFTRQNILTVLITVLDKRVTNVQEK